MSSMALYLLIGQIIIFPVIIAFFAAGFLIPHVI